MLLFLIVSETGLLDSVDRRAYNLGVTFSSDKDPHEDIVVVAIDDKSLRALGSWPWSRDVLAETMVQIGKAKPRVTAFSMPFDMGQYEASQASVDELRAILKKEKKLSRNVNRALKIAESTLHGDDNLASSFKSAGRVVLAMPYIQGGGDNSGISKSLPKYMQKFALPNVSVDSNASRGLGWPRPELARAETLFPPIAPLARQVGGIGVIGLNDTFNREPLIVRYGTEYLASFALMVATRSKGMSMQHIVSGISERPMLGGKELDTDIDYHIYPRFYEDQDGKPPFKIYSLIDVLDNSVNLKEFRQKIILVGITSARLARPQQTPAGQAIAPTLAAAHSVSSILNGELFVLPDWAGWAQRGIIVVIGLYLMFLLGRFRITTSFFLSLFLLLMILNAHFMLMSVKSIWLPMMSAAVMLIFGHLVLGTRQYVNLRLQQVRSELSISNRQLGQSL
ncbi:MAG: CHASE2 domain-containing protein, partial [Pseudomonadota bacterium]